MSSQIDLLDIQALRNRHETYRRLRADAPAMPLQMDGQRNVVVTRFDDVDALLKSNQALVQPAAGEYPPHIGSGPGALFYRLSLPHMDPPQHSLFRRILGDAFNPRAIARLQDMVAGIIDGALDALPLRKPVEVVNDLAARVPAAVACGMLHVPADRASDLFGHVPALSAIVSHAPLTEESLRAADEAARHYFAFFDELVASNRDLPTDDLVGALIKAEEGGLWTKEALATTLMGLFIASFHTTKTVIANTLHALAVHQDQYRLLAADISLAAAAWEEVLRYDSPVHFVHRYASEPMTIAGLEIAPRTRLLLGLASANRDEARFEGPDRFDIRRPAVRHLAFAMGRHFCAGSQLSRLEGKLFLEGLTKRYSALHLAGLPIKRNDDLTFPHIEELHLEFEPVG